MTRVSSTTAIRAPADAVWRAVSDFGGVCNYLVEVVACTVEGEGIGARRTLTSADGTTIVERLESLDKDARRLSYALLTDTPFHNCLTTMSVRDLGLHRAELAWSASFEADGLPASEAADLLEAALTANYLALKQFMEAGGS